MGPTKARSRTCSKCSHMQGYLIISTLVHTWYFKQRALQELSCIALLSWPFCQSEALRTAVITFLLMNLLLISLLPLRLSAGDSIIVHTLALLHVHESNASATEHTSYVCIHVALYYTYIHTFIHTYIHTWSLHATRLVALLPAQRVRDLDKSTTQFYQGKLLYCSSHG